MTKPLALADRLRQAPHRFDGLQALRLLELGAGQFGSEALPQEEPGQIAAAQGMMFAAAPVARVEPARALIAFLGLTGPLGVLPQSYTELAQHAERHRNRALAAFLDVFNHRLAGLFLRAAEKYRLALLVQRSASVPEASCAHDPVSEAMLSLAGYGTPHLRGRSVFNEEVVLFYAGLFAMRNRPAVALQSIVADYLGCPAKIEQFSGRWMPLAAAEQTRAPRAGEPPSFSRLGVDTVAGARTWDVQGHFRIVIGPVDYEQVLELAPDTPKLRRLIALVRAYAGPDLGFDLQIILRRESVPTLRFDPAMGPGAPRLGWNSWAKFLPALEDSRDIVIDPDRLTERT